MPSDAEKTDDSNKKLSPDAMKKLNEAFLSYFDGNKPGSSTIDISEKDSILELIKSGFVEEKSSESDQLTESTKTIIIGEGFIEAGDETLTYSDDPDMQTGSAIEVPEFDSKMSDVLSGAFDDISYQSVDIEMEEQRSVAEDGGRDYSKAVSDILQRNKDAVRRFSPTQQAPKISSYHHKEPSESSATKGSSTQTTSTPFTDVMTSSHDDVSKKVTCPQQTKTVPTQDIQELPVKPVKGPSSPAQAVSQNPVDAKVAVPSLSKSNVATTEKQASSADLMKKHSSQNVSQSAISEILQKHSKAVSGANSDIKSSNICSEKTTVKATKKIPGGPLAPVDIAFLYSEDHMKHDASLLSIVTHEKPERIIKAMWYLEKNKVFTDGTCTLISDFKHASEEDLCRVHGDEYVSFVKSYSDSGGGFLGDSTYMTSGSYGVARAAVGMALKAGDLLVDGKFSHAFVLTRPPGHHASSQKYGGFCLFNNAAVLARYLQHNRKVDKVLILDWDAHAGDGTMEIFYEDPTVMLISLHHDPHGFYPRKGFSEEIGENAGRGYTMNVEMPAGSSNDEYMLAFDEVVLPLVEHFSPNFIIVSCGFDAHYKEMNIGLALDSDGYHQMTEKLHSVFKGPIAFMLEGGYHDFNGQLCHSVLSSLHGRPNPVHDKQEMSSYKQNQQKQIFAQAQKKVDEAKRNHPVFSSQVA